ncbi:hypothetical protein ANO11243_079830 [Dothideomycetidae sp. 11243]|nr:hypothetical protein ANO11243_079830 [fungal sp. No.11243]
MAWLSSSSTSHGHSYVAVPSGELMDGAADHFRTRQSAAPTRRSLVRSLKRFVVIFRIQVLVVVFLVATYTIYKQQVSPTVHLDRSLYMGLQVSEDVRSFLGIRYAAPPTQGLRWRAPAPPAPIIGLQDATRAPPSCSDNEDCLFLNVHAPLNATRTSKLPVWFYIQGGGYHGLCCYNNNTQVVSEGNVVVVDMNYRTSAFGFLASKLLQSNGDLNIGLLDQRAALQWTHDHIEEFGGDPDHIVIHGTSAGAGSVAHHLTAYGGRNDGLFIGAIAQSPYIVPELHVPDLEWQFDAYVTAAQCNGTSDPLHCLRTQDIDVLRAADTDYPFPGRQDQSMRSWGPVIDGDFLQDHVLNLFDRDRFIDVPLIVGDVPGEAVITAPNAATPEEVQIFFNQNDPTLNRTQLLSITDQYPKGVLALDYEDYFNVASQAYSDAVFICPGLHITRAVARKGKSGVWNYNFNVSTTDAWRRGLGAWHMIDTGAIFGPYLYGLPLSDVALAYQSYNREFVDYTMNYFLSFVKTLSPNTLKHTNAPIFAQFMDNGTESRLKLESQRTGMEYVPEQTLKNCGFWRNLQLAADFQ